MTEARNTSVRSAWADSSQGWIVVFRECVSMNAGRSQSPRTWHMEVSEQVQTNRKHGLAFFWCVCYLCWFVWICVVCLTGGVIPPDAVLVFDVLLLDVWNTEDKVEIRTISKPASCNRTAVASDFVRYHYNGTLLNGAAFDSRWGCSVVKCSAVRWDDSEQRSGISCAFCYF